MKKIYTLFSALCLAAAAPGTLSAQNNFKLVEESVSNPDNTPAPVYPVPSERQLKWNETEFYAFFHYGMNTYTNEEWGSGMERETVFAPTQKPDPKQWLEVAQKAGMKGGIAVVKHHDGFCLWPTATTEHCTRNSSGYGKNVDIPKEFAEAARALKMKYGFYISPWDMSSPYWGKKDNNGNYTDEYAKLVFLPQCAELAKYGDDQFEMWFDGATGGDHAGGYGSYTSSQKRTIDNAQTYYDIPNLRDSIHNLLPSLRMPSL
jgi:alpha-L-fucosidase